MIILSDVEIIVFNENKRASIVDIFKQTNNKSYKNRAAYLSNIEQLRFFANGGIK
jgi:hypothetical protein